MIGSGLKKLAAQYGLNVENGVAYGMAKGCLIALSEGAGYKRLSIYVGQGEQSQAEQAADQIVVSKAGPDPAQQRAEALGERIVELASDYERYRLMRSSQRFNGVEIASDSSALSVNFFDNPGTIKRVEAFIEEVLPQVAELTRPGECALCGRELQGDACAVLMPGERVAAMDADCAGRFEDACAQQKQGSVARGMIGAAVGALIGAALWCAVGLAGYTASIVGMVTALLAGKGYDLLGGRPGRARMACIVACTLLAVAVGDAAAIGVMIWREYAQSGAELMQALGFGEYLGMMTELLVADSEFMGGVARDLLLGWLFAIIGCVAVLRKSGKNGAERVVRLHGRI